MKARIKKSGAIGDVIGTYMEHNTKMVVFANGYTVSINEVDYINSINEVDYINDVDWSSFRRDAAKDVLCAMVANNNLGYYGDSNTRLAASAIAIADELIKQLKQK